MRKDNPNPPYGKDKHEKKIIQRIKELGQYVGSWTIAKILKEEKLFNRQGKPFSSRQINRYLKRDFDFIDKKLNDRVKKRMKDRDYFGNSQKNNKVTRHVLKTFWCPLIKPTGMYFSDPISCFLIQKRRIAKDSKKCPCFVGRRLQQLYPKAYKEIKKRKVATKNGMVSGFGNMQLRISQEMVSLVMTKTQGSIG